jgi:hypothetical protein
MQNYVSEKKMGFYTIFLNSLFERASDEYKEGIHKLINVS